MNKLVWSAVLLFTFTLSCGGGGGKGAVSITEAETLFSDGSYSDALEAFADLIPSEGAPAIAGAGWCAIRLRNYAQADSFFTSAGLVTLNADGYAGWSIAEWSLGDASGALTRAAAAFNASPAFTTLSLDTRVTANHLIWIQASSYLQTGYYSECYSKILLLDYLYEMPTGTNYEIGVGLLQKLQSLGVAVAI